MLIVKCDDQWQSVSKKKKKLEPVIGTSLFQYTLKGLSPNARYVLGFDCRSLKATNVTFKTAPSSDSLKRAKAGDTTPLLWKIALVSDYHVDFFEEDMHIQPTSKTVRLSSTGFVHILVYLLSICNFCSSHR